MSQTKPLINLLKGWPSTTLLPTSSILNASQTAFSNPFVITPGLLYGPDWGYEPLRFALSKYLSSFYHSNSTSNSSEKLCITGGASQNLTNILSVYTDPSYTRNIWMISPTYFLACRVFEDAGFTGRLRAVPEGSDGVDIGFLRRELKGVEDRWKRDGEEGDVPKLKPHRPWNKFYKHIIYCVPTFANPSSFTMPLRIREELIKISREFDALVVTDDVYDQLQWHTNADSTSASGSTWSSLPSVAVQPRLVDVDRVLDGGTEREGADGFGNSVSNGSFSKIVGPGCRTGWAEGTEKFAYGLSQAGSSRSGGAPSQLTATIMAELVTSGELQRHIAGKLQPAYQKRYTSMLNAITKYLIPLGITLPLRTDGEIVGGYFLWLTLPHPLSADDVAKRAKTEENLIIAPGSLFTVYGDTEGSSNLERNFRLCFAWEDEKLLEEGIQRLGVVVEAMLKESKGGHVPQESNASGSIADLTKYQ